MKEQPCPTCDEYRSLGHCKCPTMTDDKESEVAEEDRFSLILKWIPTAFGLRDAASRYLDEQIAAAEIRGVREGWYAKGENIFDAEHSSVEDYLAKRK